MPEVIIALINLIANSILKIDPHISTAVLGTIVLVLLLFIHRAPPAAKDANTVQG